MSDGLTIDLPKRLTVEIVTRRKARPGFFIDSHIEAGRIVIDYNPDPSTWPADKREQWDRAAKLLEDASRGVYARTDGPPDDWFKLHVRNLDTGELIDCCEVHTEEGWAIVETGRAIDGGFLERERIDGRFAIERGR